MKLLFLNYLCLFITLILISCDQPKKPISCQKLKQGKFYYYVIDGSDTSVYNVERKDSLQLEVNAKTGDFVKLSINWKDDCKYELLLIETTFPLSDSFKQFRRTVPITAVVLAITNDYYVTRVCRDIGDCTMDTMRFIKPQIKHK